VRCVLKPDKRLTELVNAIAYFKFDFKQYKTIYTYDERRVNLLETTAETFFIFLSKYYKQRFALIISVLTDPPKQGNHNNLTIDIFEEIAETNKFKFKDKIISNNIKIKKMSKYFHGIRDKFLAHLNVDYLIGEKILENDSEAIEKVAEIIELLTDSCYYFIDIYGAELPPIDPIIVKGDAQDLMRYLRKGYIAEQQNRS
jgi:hypothetical protein